MSSTGQIGEDTADSMLEVDFDEVRGELLLENKDLENPSEAESEKPKYYELSDSQVKKANEYILKSCESNSNYKKPSDLLIENRTQFFSGSWENLIKHHNNPSRTSVKKYNLILTSETIYDTDSQQSLYDCILNFLEKPKTEIDTETTLKQKNKLFVNQPAAFIAAKTMYFGLTGSVLSFKQLVLAKGDFNVETVWKSNSGFQREILKLTWL
ncbi:hypothetical protein BB560_003532 [Smittium megazygosporum]|uniref:Uncharacterized protein n=1 Tax=Smittium megazygosporum TaxID=133381 RepID=A0A2T9ZBS6_9FUNG|nr:hypothetical protein BB560_003532 [Smittium megazygosporum]